MAEKRAGASRVARLTEAGLMNPPRWLVPNLMFEALAGSEAYGCRDPESSDTDVVGYAIPPKHSIFPHLDGHVLGLGPAPNQFRQFQAHHVEDRETRRTYDVTVYGIVRYFDLTMGCNPNMTDSLFSPRRCVTRSSQVHEHLRHNRRLFLSTKCYHTFRGYANSQLAKIRSQRNRSNPKRQESIDQYGYDVKFGYHLVRLMLECEQILTTGDLVLDRDAGTYVSIRRGEWDLDRLVGWFEAKEKALEAALPDAVVPHAVDRDAVRDVLMQCLEIHFGDLGAVVRREEDGRLLRDLEELLRRHGR